MPISSQTVTVIDSSGASIVVAVAAAVPTSGVMVMGSDGTLSRFISTDTTGRTVVVGPGTAGTPAGGVVSIQGVSGGVAIPVSGTVTAANASVSTTGSAVPASATFIGGSDGTNLVTLRIKAASTAAVTTDPSLVVAFSPNSPLPAGASIIGGVTQSGTWTSTVTQATAANLNATVVGLGTAGTASGGVVSIQNPDTTASAALGALNAVSAIPLAGSYGVGFQLAAGTLIGTIVPELSFDGGTTWIATQFDDPATSNKTSSITFASANAATARAIVGSHGSSNARVRVSAYTSGTATCAMRATTIADPSVLYGGQAGSALPPVVAQVGGSDGTLLRALLTDTSGRPIVVGAGTAGTATGGVVTIQGIAGGVAIPVSGTVTAANASVSATGSAVPASATFIGGSDGTNLVTVRIKAASTATVATDPSLVVAFSPNSPLPAGTNNIGTVTLAGLGFPFLVTGNVAAGAATSGNPVLIGGSDGTDIRYLKVAADGTLLGRITDGTNTATVKAASTAAVATDTALVVALSPNNPVAADVTVTGALGALNATVQISTSGLETVGFQLQTGTLTGTLTPELSWDGGTNWSPCWFVGPLSLGVVATLVNTSPNAAQGKMIATMGGVGLVRVRVSAYTSGTANGVLRASQTNPNTIALAGEQTGTAVPPMVLQVGGSDGTNLHAMATDTSGRLQVVGAAADGAPSVGAPVLIGGSDGTDAQTLKVATDGSLFGRVTDGTNTATVKASGVAAGSTDTALVVSASPNSVTPIGGIGGTSSYPDPGEVYIDGLIGASVDQFGNLQTRGPIFTDEESFRDDFSGSSLTSALTGTLTFVNGSATVAGTGTAFTTQLTAQSYIRLTADANSTLVRVSSISSDTSLTLVSGYTGTSTTGASVTSNWAIGSTAGSLTVGSSVVNIISGTANGNITSLQRSGDFLPFVLTSAFLISQRVANQNIFVGFVDTVPASVNQVGFLFTGTDNTKVTCITSFAADSVQSSTITLGSSGTTATQHTYEVDVSSNIVAFLIDDIVVAQLKLHVPPPYATLNIGIYVQNTGTVTATTLTMDALFFQNTDQVQIGAIFKGEPVPTQLYGKAATTGLLQSVATDGNGNLNVIASSIPSTSTPGIAFGDPTLAAITQAAVRRTTYTEQTANFTGSVKSSSANDAAAGTGARTVTITWVDSTGATTGTEVVTLNGTTAVNLVTTTKCFIEKMIVSTVGTGGSAAGTISLFTGAAGAGTTVGTIGTGDNQTYWAHHYVITGKTCNVTSTLIGSNATVAGNGAVYVLKATTIAIANSPERQISDFLTLYGQSSQVPRNYGSYLQAPGPSRVTMYVTPNAGTSTVFRGSFDYYDA